MRKMLGRLTAIATGLFAILAFATPAHASSGPLLQSQGGGINKCATPQGNSTANGTALTLWSCNGSPLQQFEWDGYYIKHVSSGKCITPSGNASDVNGAVLTLWTCTGSTVQRFTDSTILGPNGYSHIYTIHGGKCITNKGDNMTNGTWLTLWTCNNQNGGSLSQDWTLH